MDISEKHRLAALEASRAPALEARLALLAEDTQRATLALYPAPRPAPGAPPHLASGVTVTAAGTLDYDDTTHPVQVDAGTISEDWTVTITDGATGALSVAGATVGVVWIGSLAAAISPINPSGGLYFRLGPEGWSGTATTGDTLALTTTRVVPIATLTLTAGAGEVDAEAKQIQLEVPIEGQVTGAGPEGTDAAWGRITDGTGDWWGDCSASDSAGTGELKLQTVTLYDGAWCRLTSCVIQG